MCVWRVYVCHFYCWSVWALKVLLLCCHWIYRTVDRCLRSPLEQKYCFMKRCPDFCCFGTKFVCRGGGHFLLFPNGTGSWKLGPLCPLSFRYQCSGCSSHRLFASWRSSPRCGTSYTQKTTVPSLLPFHLSPFLIDSVPLRENNILDFAFNI